MSDEWQDIAHYYDDLYVKPELYQLEAIKTISLIEKYKQSEEKDLLDIACGTGGHIPYWQENHFNVNGLDLSPEMLSYAKYKYPNIDFHLGDMVSFRLNRNYDALVCLYGSIGFVRIVERLYEALFTFSTHLKPGGILCITPWSTKEEFEPKIVVDAIKHPHVRITRMENVKRKSPNLVEVDFHHLVGQNGKVTYYTQSMEIGLFSKQQYQDAINRANLELKEYYQGQDMPMGIFVALKPLCDKNQ